MRWWLALIACGCNELYGLEPTTVTDARPPAMCPAGGAPMFYGDLHLVKARGCITYTPNFVAKTALADCDDGVGQAALDQPMAGSITFVPAASSLWLVFAPEGDRAYTQGYDADLVQYGIVTYAPSTATTWTSSAFQPVTPNYFELGTPSRAPDRRAVYDFQGSLVELAEDNGAWSEVRRYSRTEVMPVPLSEISLTADGLRMVFIVSQTINMVSVDVVGYAQRATKNDHFGAGQILDGVPAHVGSPYLSPDCGRLYFSGLDTVFYLE